MQEENKKTKKLTAEDWELVRIDYITGRLSVRQLCDKYGCGLSSFQYQQKKGSWNTQKNAYKKAVLNKAIDKIGDKEAEILAVEWEFINDIEHLLGWALKERENFVTSYFINKDELKSKFDFDALMKATKTIETIEKLKRNIKGLLKEEQKQNIKIKQEYLKIEQEKNKPTTEAEIINVIELPAILEQTTEAVKKELGERG